MRQKLLTIQKNDYLKTSMKKLWKVMKMWL